MSHTPGPWEVNTQAGPQIREVFAGDVLICDCGLVTFSSESECESNTRLIAEAPELLAALKDLIAMYGPSTDYGYEAERVWRRAETAIAKAEGR